MRGPEERAAEHPAGRPRLVFFRPTSTDLPSFVDLHLRDHVRCLQHWFDVVLVVGNADFDEVCDREKPDLVLFESGVYVRPDRWISNTNRHLEIPRIGLLNSDPYCLTRTVFLSDMNDWGVETYFTIGVTTAAHTPDIADRLYVWPNFADRSLFRTYPGGKTTSILLTGSRRPNYPWRVKVDRALSERFPIRSLPHNGWFGRSMSAEMTFGELYARELSSAQIVPTCGTIADELVRKHFEIPAAGSLLLTERTPSVEAAGFADMENCIFAEASDAVDKVDFLLKNPEAIARITSAGQHLAHERHDISNRSQIWQWFELERRRRPGETILQQNPFGDLVLGRNGVARKPVTYMAPPSRDGRLLLRATDSLGHGRLGAAMDDFAEVLNQHLEPEASLGLARCYLRIGEPALARDLVWRLIDRAMSFHGASTPDPVEWAVYLRSLVACGTADAAARKAAEFPFLNHPELARVLHVLRQLSSVDGVPDSANRPEWRSLHVVHEGWIEWKNQLIDDLTACGQQRAVQVILHVSEPDYRPPSVTAGALRDEPATPRSRPAKLQGRKTSHTARIAARVGRRLRRRAPQVQDESLFSLLGDDSIEAAIAILVDEKPILLALERLVANDPTNSAVIRIGRESVLPPGDSAGGAVGRRGGASRKILSRVPLLGRSLILAGPRGADLLEIPDLSAAEVLILVRGRHPGDARLLRQLESSNTWRRGDDQLIDHFARALTPVHGLDVWCSVSRHEEGYTRDT